MQYTRAGWKSHVFNTRPTTSFFVAKPFHGSYMTAFLRDMGRRYRVALVGTLLVLCSNFDLKS